MKIKKPSVKAAVYLLLFVMLFVQPCFSIIIHTQIVCSTPIIMVISLYTIIFPIAYGAIIKITFVFKLMLFAYWA